jgi:predicted CoA-substrate-specific enzyme activase
MKILGIDVGSTTVKAVLVENDRILWQAYRRHHTKQAETVLEFLEQMEKECGLQPGRDIILFTGSGSGFISPLVGGRFIQEVVAVAAAVERFHPQVNFVSEIGGEDMKTIFFTTSANGKSKQVYMQSACSGGTGTFIEKTARKLNIAPESLAQMNYDGLPLHKISSKCGIFAEADANTLIKGGVAAEEVVASLFEAVVHQNLATLTKGNTPMPEVLLLGGPNLFFKGLQQAWRRNLAALWADRRIIGGQDADALIHVPAEALYYASLGCIEIARHDGGAATYYSGTTELRRWIEHGQHEEKARQGSKGLVSGDAEREDFLRKYVVGRPALDTRQERSASHANDRAMTPVLVGCDFGSTTAKAVVLAADKTLLFTCYALSRGNPIEDAKDLLRQIRQAGFQAIGGLALTGYGKDLLNDILGADVSVVETVAHARAALHFFPDADVICDVGGCDIKVMILRNGTVADFRLNSQCSSGNGAFLQGVAERYGVPLENYADRAFRAKSLPQLAMGCGVFLQSDIVNQQRKGWSADEIMASLAAVLPLNVWVYACQLQNLRAVGRKFVLQGGTHLNAAVVKAQVDFITSKVPDAEIAIHPYSGEAGAIGAALCAADDARDRSRFRGFAAVEALTYRTTTNDHTVCHWCSCNCKRTFIDVQLPGAAGRPWSKIPVPEGWERVISGNSCPKGLLEDVDEMRIVKARIDEAKRAYPNVAEMVRATAFRRA